MRLKTFISYKYNLYYKTWENQIDSIRLNKINGIFDIGVKKRLDDHTIIYLKIDDETVTERK